MDNLRLYFNDLGFSIEPISQSSFLAKKKGANFILLKYTDYYFVRYVDEISIDIIRDNHDTSKIVANSDFKLPKALRFSVPNINTVFVYNNTISSEVIDYIKERETNLIGGQQDSIFVLDTLDNNMYCAGKEFTHISGEAKLIWGNKKEFKTINGRNRSHALMTDLFKKLGK